LELGDDVVDLELVEVLLVLLGEVSDREVLLTPVLVLGELDQLVDPLLVDALGAAGYALERGGERKVHLTDVGQDAVVLLLSDEQTETDSVIVLRFGLAPLSSPLVQLGDVPLVVDRERHDSPDVNVVRPLDLVAV